MWVARLRDCRSPGWCSRWNSRDGGGPTLLGGVKEVGGVGHPRASTLTPRVSESSVCPPGSLRSHMRQSAEPSHSLSPTRVARHGHLVVWFSFGWSSISSKFKDQPGKRTRRSGDSSVEASVRRTSHEGRCMFSIRA